MRFIVWDFHDLQKFTNFLLREMFSPKRYKADFERNCKILTVKPLILNKITKFSLETFFLYTVRFISNDCYSTMMSNDITCCMCTVVWA